MMFAGPSSTCERLHHPNGRLMIMSAASLTARAVTFHAHARGTFPPQRADAPPDRAPVDDVRGEFDGQGGDFSRTSHLTPHTSHLTPCPRWRHIGFETRVCATFAPHWHNVGASAVPQDAKECQKGCQREAKEMPRKAKRKLRGQKGCRGRQNGSQGMQQGDEGMPHGSQGAQKRGQGM